MDLFCFQVHTGNRMWRTCALLRFFRHRAIKRAKHEIFWEDEKAGLPKKLSRKEQQARKDAVTEIDGKKSKATNWQTNVRKIKPQTGQRHKI